MFKAFTILALGAIASAQFLNRDLQGATASVTLQQTATSIPSNNVNASSAAPACTASATADTCPGTHCCARLSRAGAVVAAPASVCAPVWFNGVAFNVSGVINTWNCANTINSVAWANLTASRPACVNDSTCAVGSCCAAFTHTFGPAAAPGTVTTRACVDGTKNGTAVWNTFATTPATEGRTIQGSCTNVAAPESFGAYIKASAMMVVALLSVALF